jgi:hypothetical protein
MKNLIGLIAIAATLALQGCMTYSHNQLQPVEQWPLIEESKVKPSVYLKAQSEYRANENPSISANVDKLEALLRQEFVDSGRFSRVSTQQEKSDIYVTATLRNQEDSNIALAMITGFTMFLVPATFDNTLTLDLVFRDGQGNQIGKVEKQEKLTTWMHLILIFALPFNESLDKLLSDLAQSALEEAAKQNLI